MKGKDLAAPTSVVLIRWIPKKTLAQSPEGQTPLGVAQDIFRILDAVLLQALQMHVAPVLQLGQVLLTKRLNLHNAPKAPTNY